MNQRTENKTDWKEDENIEQQSCVIVCVYVCVAVVFL